MYETISAGRVQRGGDSRGGVAGGNPAYDGARAADGVR